MPNNCNFIIKDTVTGLYLTYYSTEPENCLWGNKVDAICFETQQQVNDTIATLGGDAGRFIGQNPNIR